MDWSLEVVVLPVGDIDRSVAFYRDQVGFHLDPDTRNDQMHVVQLTPPGSGCSALNRSRRSSTSYILHLGEHGHGGNTCATSGSA
jgi:catechol 2,3-dioxygenase-like lactoylglutathione lyase family enzyme